MVSEPYFIDGDFYPAARTAWRCFGFNVSNTTVVRVFFAMVIVEFHQCSVDISSPSADPMYPSMLLALVLALGSGLHMLCGIS